MNLDNNDEHVSAINNLWQAQETIFANDEQRVDSLTLLKEVIAGLDQGVYRSCDKVADTWQVNLWIKKAIMLFFKFSKSELVRENHVSWFDKIPTKFSNWSSTQFEAQQLRAVPGAYVRQGVYLGRNVVLMPCFINIGAYIDQNTMIDTWATVGSCAQIGKNCHISGGVGIGGVLEPIQARPVIIEDNCFIGARSQIAEGTIIGEGSVIGMGTYIGNSIKIIDRHSGKEVTETDGCKKIPPYSVVVPGSMPNSDPYKPSLKCAVIVKQVSEEIRAKTAINELLRN